MRRTVEALVVSVVVFTVVLAGALSIFNSMARPSAPNITVTATYTMPGTTTTVITTITTSQSTSTSSFATPGTNSTPQSTGETSLEGLMLSATLNATALGQGEAIGVSAELFNTLNRTLALYPQYEEYSNITGWQGYSRDDCVDYFPIYIAVFSGHVEQGNISAAGDPLQIASTMGIPCALTFPMIEIDMQPNSSDATIVRNETTLYPLANGTTETIVQNETSTGTMATSLDPFQCVNSTICGNFAGAAGYYVGSTMDEFPVGPYTVVVADLWGEALFIYFEVV